MSVATFKIPQSAQELIDLWGGSDLTLELLDIEARVLNVWIVPGPGLYTLKWNATHDCIATHVRLRTTEASIGDCDMRKSDHLTLNVHLVSG